MNSCKNVLCTCIKVLTEVLERANRYQYSDTSLSLNLKGFEIWMFQVLTAGGGVKGVGVWTPLWVFKDTEISPLPSYILIQTVDSGKMYQVCILKEWRRADCLLFSLSLLACTEKLGGGFLGEGAFFLDFNYFGVGNIFEGDVGTEVKNVLAFEIFTSCYLSCTNVPIFIYRYIYMHL